MAGEPVAKRNKVDQEPAPTPPMPEVGFEWQPAPLHFKVPHGIWIKEATAVACDSEGNVYCFNRGNMPVLVFNDSGDLIRHWGNPTPFEGTTTITDPYGNKIERFVGTEYARPHAITIDAWNNVWLVDDLANTITKCTTTGERLIMLLPNGKVLTDKDEMQAAAGKCHDAPPKHSGIRFNRPTDIAVHSVTGDLFVTDGYGNSHIHHLKGNGELVKSWGEPGTQPGQLNLPHGIAIHVESKTLLVADRENSRVQFFTLDGQFKRQWFVHRVVSVATCTLSGGCYVLCAEQGTLQRVQQGGGSRCSCDLIGWTPNIGNCISIHSLEGDGRRLTKIGGAIPGEQPDHFLFPHMVAVNQRGDIYVADVSFTEFGKWQSPNAREMVSLRRFTRTS